MKLFREINWTLKSNPRQTFIGIWLHDDNLEDEAKCKMELYLTQIFYYYRIFTTFEELITYLVEKKRVAKIFFIISILDSLIVDALVDLVQECPKSEKVYGFGPMQDFIPNCFNTNNINDLFTEILQDIDKMAVRTNRMENVENETSNELKPMNISRTTKMSTSLNKVFSKLEPNTPIRHITEASNNFLNFLAITTIFFEISYKDNEIADMWRACRKFYEKDKGERSKIDSLAKKYHPNDTIRYYTESSCVFRRLNHACRTENVQTIYEFRVYIRDMHVQLKRLHSSQINDRTNSSIRKVHRGKVLSPCVLQQLIDNEHRLISLNGFLSTSLKPEVADVYSGTDQPIEDSHIPVRFTFTINNVQQPYAKISSCSAVPDDEEVLFSLGTIWRIDSVELQGNFYEIKLTSHNTLDNQLDELLQKYIKEGYTLSLVGDILRDMGNYEEAEWFYQKVLKQDQLPPETCAQLHFHIGMMRKELGNDFPAVESFKKAAHLFQTSNKTSIEIKTSEDIYTYDTESILIGVYNNMATLHEKNGDAEEAITCCHQALEKNGSQLDMAKVRNKLGRLYFDDGNYEQARKYYTEAIALIDESYPCWTEFNKNLQNTD